MQFTINLSPSNAIFLQQLCGKNKIENVLEEMVEEMLLDIQMLPHIEKLNTEFLKHPEKKRPSSEIFKELNL